MKTSPLVSRLNDSPEVGEHEQQIIMQVLIVDHQRENIFTISSVLNHSPIEIHCANSGKKALEEIQHTHYGLIIFDTNIPDMNSFDCAQKIRSHSDYSHTPILFLTTPQDENKNAEKSAALGPVDFLCKPIDTSILQRKVALFVALEERHQRLKSDLVHSRETQKNHEKILNFIADGVIALDTENKITFANSAASTLLTTPKGELIGKDIKTYIAPKDKHALWQQSDFVQTFEEGQCNHCDNTLFWRQEQLTFPVQYTQSSIMHDESVVGGALVFQDISERKELESKLLNLAKYDQLTGLANRTRYWEFLQRSIEVSRRNKQKVYTLILDLDNFKEINDTYGHDAGDILLTLVTKRISSSLRSADLICRLGGDEFAIIVQDTEPEASVIDIAEKLIKAFEPPFFVYEKQAYVGCSIGIAAFPNDGENANEITKSADTAMYSAKKSGKNNFCFFQKEMQERVQEHVQVANELRSGLDNQEIIPYYQLKTDIRTGAPVGAEALARWIHPQRGIIPPFSFISIAEDTGLIEPLGESILIQAGRKTQEIRQLVDNPNFRTAINVSIKQIRRRGFSTKILQLFDRHQIDPRHIELELTESCLMDNSQSLINELNSLRSEGVHISIDDFGTGYSSLSYLKRIPLDTLKIDQSFVRDIGQDSDNENIIKAIIQLAHNLELYVTAEGVETEDQLNFLASLDCDQAQGYLFGKPKSAEDFLLSLASATLSAGI